MLSNVFGVLVLVAVDFFVSWIVRCFVWYDRLLNVFHQPL
jgi:hypothetical protein